MTDREAAARVTLVDDFATKMDLPLSAEQIAEWVEALSDMPLAWLAFGLKRCFATFEEKRRPRPADVRRCAREVAGPGFIQDEQGFSQMRPTAWPSEAPALRRMREGKIVTEHLPPPTAVKLPELPQEAGWRQGKPAKLGALIEAALQEAPELDVAGGES